jgi:hypothetical protein
LGRYAAFVKQNCQTLPTTVVWDAMETLFPAVLGVADTLDSPLRRRHSSPVSALDAFVRLGESLRTSRRARESRPDFIAQIGKTPQRRRLAFWRYAEKLAGHRMLGGRLATSIWDLTMLGWTVNLSLDDIDWLLEDAPKRRAEDERQLAIDAAMMIWRDAGRPDSPRDRIAAVVGQDAVMASAFDSWIMPRPTSLELVKSASA